MHEVEEILRQAAFEGVIECPECGNKIEPDCDACPCGWINPVVEMGMI